MQPSPARVVARYQVRQLAFRVASELKGPRTAASQEINGEVLAAFAEAFCVSSQDRVAKINLRSLGKKLKQLGTLFKKAPRVWEQFKKLVGVKSLSDLPRVLKDLAKRGLDLLKKSLSKLFNTMPFRMYTIGGMGLNDLMVKLTKQIPGLDKILGRLKAKGDQLGIWLREKAPVISGVLIVAIFIFIWLNVTEFEWDLHYLSKVLAGQIMFGDLLASLPGSGLGFLMNSLGFGTFTLLPATMVMRAMWLYQKDYLVWDGRRLSLNEEAILRDGYHIKGSL